MYSNINESQIDLNRITEREKEVLAHLAYGKTNKEISQCLMLSPSTIRNHISSIFTKLNISNRSQATALAIYGGLVNFSASVTTAAS